MKTTNKRQRQRKNQSHSTGWGCLKIKVVTSMQWLQTPDLMSGVYHTYLLCSLLAILMSIWTHVVWATAGCSLCMFACVWCVCLSTVVAIDAYFLRGTTLWAGQELRGWRWVCCVRESVGARQRAQTKTPRQKENEEACNTQSEMKEQQRKTKSGTLGTRATWMHEHVISKLSKS